MSVTERKEQLCVRPRVAPLAARPAKRLPIVCFAFPLARFPSSAGKMLALARSSTLDPRRIRVIHQNKKAPHGCFLFWSRRRESNSPGTAWEAAAIPLGDACTWKSVIIIFLFWKNVNTFSVVFILFPIFGTLDTAR